MIHEAKVIFHQQEYFAFTRKQDAKQYELETQYDVYIMIDRINLSFLVDHENPLCKIKTKIIDFNVAKKDLPHHKEKELTIYFIPPAKKSGEHFHIPLATIKSSKHAITEIKQAIDKHRKYKSCLAFVPSRVKHISILSGQSPTQRFRGFINLAGVMFLILNLRNIIQNFIKYGIMFGNTPLEYIPVHFLIALTLLLIFPFTAFAIEKLKFKNILAPALAKLVLILNLFSILGYNTLYCILFKPSPMLAITFTGLSIIILLKLISYYQVNRQLYAIIRRINKKDVRESQKDLEVEMFTHYEISQENLDYIVQFKDKWDNIINLKKLMYFIFIPTLCYQLFYPQTSSIRYTWLAKRVIQLLLVSGLQLILWFQYIEPELKELLAAVHDSQSTWYELFNRHLRLSIPNTIMWITGFYSIFHLWLNIMGEILYFGDRNFYRDWWNCRNLEQYWKTWNLPVHFWFIRHLYNPLLQLGSSRTAANLIVFFVSAIAHEYLVSVPLGFISYWAFLAMIMQAPTIFIQRKIDKILRIQNSELSNVSFWIFFCIIGQPLVVFIYYAMYTDCIYNKTTFKIPTFIPIDVPKIDLNISL